MGLQTNAQSIVHAAGQEPIPARAIKPLPFGSVANFDRWSVNVRHQLCGGEFFANYSVTPNKRSKSVDIKWCGRKLLSIARPTEKQFADELQLVHNYADQRADRTAEILTQLGSLSDYYSMIMGLTGSRNPYTLELIAIVSGIAGQATMMPKHLLACRRPDELDGRMLPVIPTPGHGSFPSGHATQAHAVSHVLQELVRQNAKHFPDVEARCRMISMTGHRIAVNRTVAGVHFPIDSWVGAILGTQVARLIVAGATGGKTASAKSFDFKPAHYAGRDFLHHESVPVLDKLAGKNQTPDMDGLAWLWSRCMAEFALNA